jgi:hypothetical protein
MTRRTDIIDTPDTDEGFHVAHAVLGAARDRHVWVVYKTAHGLFADRGSDRSPFKRSVLIATVRHIEDNIVDVTYESDGRIERLYV